MRANKRTREEIKQRNTDRLLQTILSYCGHYPFQPAVAFQPPYKMVQIYLLLLSSALFVSAEHSGAYSSPQYAKKMYPRRGQDTNELLPREKPPVLFKEEQVSIARFDNGNDTAQYGRSSFLDAAGSFLSGTGGQVVTSIARDFISRSTGSSQVGFDCVSQVRTYCTQILKLHAFYLCMSNKCAFCFEGVLRI